MPFVDVKTRTGNLRFKYTICTPTSTDASSFEPDLPTILFIHAAFASQIMFHSQFADPRLRRFNLVTFDTREHGETIGENIPLTYDQYDATEDTVRFMDAISLPPCHVCGLSSGTTIALQLALSHPKRVLSLTLLSQLCLEEPPEVSEVLDEIYELWKSAFADAETADEEILQEALLGVTQYAYTDHTQMSKTAIGISQIINSGNLRKWTSENLGTCKTIVLDFLKNRKSHSIAELSSITCPVLVINGDNAVAYPVDYDERFRKQLEEAGVQMSTATIPHAPHFLSIDYGNVINPLLYDLVISQSDKDFPLPAIQPARMVYSPWHSQLKEWSGSDFGEYEGYSGYISDQY
ncbi:alpha beta hydrolase [Moniliophthora roreri MCA 2997]|nr:alpha beta hydrolase [Moniliophthora roreri MCA 2997]